MDRRGNLTQFLSVVGLAAGLLATADIRLAEARESDAEKAAEPVVQPSNAPFMKPLGRLATIMGSIHFLRDLCSDPNADVWRQKMADLLAAQGPNAADKRILVAHFNEGYRAFESTYRKCTPSATVALERYLHEGATLSREISARYGN